MPGSTFKTHPYRLDELLRDCDRGFLQLPDFQRSWVWDEERIKSLISSVSRAFPIGALMTLETGGEVDFKPRPIEGAPASAGHAKPQSLLLDGQQRMTSLYQVALRGKVVETITSKKKKVERWLYIDIAKALDATVDRDEAIVSVPEDRKVTEDFGRNVVLDLSSREREFEHLMYPVSMVFQWDDWQKQFIEYSMNKGDFAEKWDVIRQFKEGILDNFIQYQVPVIALGAGTSKEAVCVVFEKVNTGGKALDAFELVTAMYAAEGHELRRDWYGKDGELGRQHRFVETLRPASRDSGIIAEVSNTDFLHAVSLFHTRERRREAEKAGKEGKELPAVSGNRNALLNKPEIYDSIINKTPLSYRTNRIIGGVGPSTYLSKLETGDSETPSIPSENLDRYLVSHLIDPGMLRADDFQTFMNDRQSKLLRLIEQATGKAPYRDGAGEEEAETDVETAEAELTMAAA